MKHTDFYLLKQKSISEGDLFVTDYIKTKQRRRPGQTEMLCLAWSAEPELEIRKNIGINMQGTGFRKMPHFHIVFNAGY